MSVGVLAGAGPASGDQTTATTLAYTCAFPSGARQATLQINATFPETAATSIAPTGVTAKLDLPQTALGDLTTINAASVTASADLSLVVKHNGDATTATWPNLTAPSAPLPSTGDLTVTMTGPVPPVSETGAGDVTFAADAFGLILTPLTSAGAATTPATVKVACTLNPNQTATLATVAIPGTPTTTTPGVPAQHPAAPPHKHLVKGMDLPVDPQCDPNRPGGSGVPGDGSQVVAVIDGRTNLAKLNESTAVDGQITLTNIGFWFSDDFTVSVICYTGQLDIADSTATILGFGFVPITTTLRYVQVNTPDNPMFVEASTNADPQYPDGHPTGHAGALVDIYVASASINGTPLNVGSRCHTSKPVSLVLDNIPNVDSTNSEVYPYNGVSGGYMQTLSKDPDNQVTIPPFTGCGVGDNLDNLLSAPVAGPDNLVRVCQGTAIPAGSGDPPPPDATDNHCTAP
ncbi:MAG TPA: DUF6801 domain-containing protein [Pseudonocardiaceae bacterium]|nr:DUF6801 domain-containing protein [Pseudonocardiaceae bacterium]